MRASRSLLVAAAALVAGALTAPAAATAAVCPKPGKITVRQTELGAASVSWRPAARLREAQASFRVLRGRTVVGQTTRTRMIVRARPGRRITIRVGVVGRAGRAPRCWAARTVRMTTKRVSRPPAAPDAPTGLTGEPRGDRALAVTWTSAAGARGYRVLRDGATVAQTSVTSLTVAVTPGVGHTITVIAVGSAGKLSPPSPALRFGAATRPPDAVTGLETSVVTSNAVRLTWQRATPGTAGIRGYRISRNGLVVKQAPGTEVDITGLAQDRHYDFTVAAVDLRGIVGPPRTVSARTAMPAPTRGAMHAFVLASTDDSFRALQRNYDRVGVAYPTYFDCVHSDVSEIKGADDPLITRWMKDRRIEVLPRFNCQRPATLRAIFNQPEARRQLIDKLVALATEHDYDGINLDFEAGAPQDRDPLTAFVADLAGALHRSGRKLSVDVSPKVRDVPDHPRSTFYDYMAISHHADWVWVMSWGLHWSTSKPGPIAPATWLRQVYDYVATMPARRKFIMGLPLYGYDWANGGGLANPATPRTYAEIQALIARTGASVRRDAASGELTFSYVDERGAPHEVWFSDGQSVAERLRIGPERGLGGFGVWRLGQEDPAFWTQPTIAG